MTACLRCDGCGTAVAEHEGDLRKWWRLARHGMEWANEPMEMRSFPAPSFTHVVFGDMDPDDMPEMGPDGMMMLPDEDDDVSYNVLHFCSAACLSDWSGQAAALD